MSTVHPPQSNQSSKQWWSKVPTPKSATVSYRPPKITTNIVPLHGSSTPPDKEEKKPLGRTRSNSAIKFNTLASAMGFRSKKTLHIPNDRSSGPLSPPLPFQNPPSSAPPARRTIKLSGASINSSICGPLSPGEPSIFTLPSSDDASEPLTPSEPSRNRSSYQPSFFTFAERDKHASVSSEGGGGPKYFVPRLSRVSVMSDSSVADSPSKHDSTQNSMFTRSPSSYYSSGVSNKSHRRKSSGESRSSNFSSLRSSLELKHRENRLSDNSMPAGSKRVPAPPARRTLRKFPSALPSISSISAVTISPSKEDNDPLPIPLRSPNSGSSGRSQEERSRFDTDSDGESDILRSIKDEIASAHGSFVDDTASLRSQVRLTPISTIAHPKTQNDSRRSSNASRHPSPSVVTSLPTPKSAMSHPGSGSISSPLRSPGSLSTSTSSSSLHRKPSSVRLRAVPPSRTPPPMSDLPPTPNSQPPSPLTFRSPKAVSSTSLLNSSLSSILGGGNSSSILTADLPPSESESESPADSLCFAHPDIATDQEIEITTLNSPSSSLHSEARSFPRSSPRAKSSSEDTVSRAPKSYLRKVSSITPQTSFSSTPPGRGDTPTPRSLRKSFSQSSMSISIGLTHRERTRVDSNTSTSNSSLQHSEESVVPGVHYTISSFGKKSLRKQRSLHNARAAANSLIPPLPPMLRHASSFNSESASISDSITPTSATHPVHNSSSKTQSASTPPTQRKRLLFRERRDSSLTHEKDKEEFNSVHGKKSHQGQGIGLSLFTNPFGPYSSHSSERQDDAGRYPVTPPHAPTPPPISPADVMASPLVDQHILPPAELLSQMEALADMEEPSSPLLFSQKSMDFDDEDAWSMDSSSIADKGSLHSNVGSVDGMSITFGQSNGSDTSSLSPSLIGRQLSSSNMPSIHSRLQSDHRPSTASKLPTRRSSLVGSAQRARPSTGQAFQDRPTATERLSGRRDSHGFSINGDFVSTALPPPPRRPGKAVFSPLRESIIDDDNDDGMEVRSSVYTPSLGSTVRPMHRQISHETLPFNANRGSIFRKPSFLNIDDDLMEIPGHIMESVIPDDPAEDSFLILEQGKDSLDIRRSFDHAHNFS